MSGLVKVIEDYNPRNVIGEHFEELVSQLFGLVRIDQKAESKVPDLVSEDGSFYVEVKASHFGNGGVIIGEQLFRFDREINPRRFYAFVYHSLTNIKNSYPTTKVLKNALDMKSFFLFPFSIVKAFYKNSKTKKSKVGTEFAQLKEEQAKSIFYKENEMWKFLKLNMGDYNKKNHKKLYVMTRRKHLETEIMKSVIPSKYEKKY